jgi:FSR family fosmidomycin resistance protein-like MFS transporter
MSVASAKADMESLSAPVARPNVYMAVLLALGLSHLQNDMIQALIPAVYPILKDSFALDFVRSG